MNNVPLRVGVCEGALLAILSEMTRIEPSEQRTEQNARWSVNREKVCKSNIVSYGAVDAASMIADYLGKRA